jgi:protein-tyrosine phosphatase
MFTSSSLSGYVAGKLHNCWKTVERKSMIQVLFVCLGNICRSPMAEAVMRHLVAHEGLANKISVESVGTGDWHVGQPPHPGTQAVLQRNQVECAGEARQVTRHDVESADYIIAMDNDNVRALQQLDSSLSTKGRVRRLLEFASVNAVLDVPDPYYTGDFDTVYQLVTNGCQGLLTHIRHEHKL